MPGLNTEVKSSVKIIDKISKFRKVGFNLHLWTFKSPEIRRFISHKGNVT